MESFYVISKAKPSMLQNPRIKSAGHHTGHRTMNDLFTKNEAQFDLSEWTSELEKRNVVESPEDLVKQIKSIATAI
eukprot:1285472-Amphidinium_carterae.2